MSRIVVFFLAFGISFLGSIPPGSINISVMQLSIQQQRGAALSLALGAVLIESIYAGISLSFLQLLSEKELLYQILMWITGLGLMILGMINFFSSSSSKSFNHEKNTRKRNSFLKGVFLGLINPLSIPFWLGMTTYLSSNGWLHLGSDSWFYIFGLASGTFFLMIMVDLLGSRFRAVADNRWVVHRLPGILFMIMGLYYLITL